MNKLFAIALLAVITSPAVFTGSMLPPTCNPNDPSCTLSNGCNGGACFVSSVGIDKK